MAAAAPHRTRRSKRLRSSETSARLVEHTNSKTRRLLSSPFNHAHLNSLNLSAVFQVVYSPESWSCAVSGSTEDVLLLLGSGKVLSRTLAVPAAAAMDCPLLLEINGLHRIFIPIAGHLDDVTADAAAVCPPLKAVRKGLAAMQPHNRISPSSAAARWARLRALVRFMTLPCFSLAARRRRQAEALHSTAVHRMRNLLLHRAFAGWRSRHSKSAETDAHDTGRIHVLTPRLCGLRNLGNTCYLNATLQCLLHCSSLRAALQLCTQHLTQHKAAVPGHRRLLGHPPTDKPPLIELQLCLGGLSRAWSASPAPSLLVPQDILEALWRAHPQFVGFRQQDAQELLCALIESLQPGAAQGAQGACPADVFRHTTVQQAVCGTCKHISESQQQCCAPVTVTLPPAAQSFKAPGRRGASSSSSTSTSSSSSSNKGTPAVQLSDLLQQELHSTEDVEGMQCEACGARGTGQRRVGLLHPPTLLAVHVNRTSWAHGGRKVQTYVHAPVEMALPYGAAGKQACRYTLVGMVVHHGRSLGCGHYTACARLGGAGGGDAWLLLNDDRVSRICQEEALGQQVYLCCYEQV